MHLKYVYRTLNNEERIVFGDEWTLASLLNSNLDVWAPCDSFLGRRAEELADRGRIIFRRREYREVVPDTAPAPEVQQAG